MIQTSGLAELPISQIHQSTFNPRHYFDEAKMDELVESVKEDGVIQPILVRPIDGHYEIVAGERRWRASQVAGKNIIPCKIEEMDDKTAIRRATKENLEREDMTAIEESYSAQTALTLVDGDRKAACAVLGWNETKLSKRLLLLNLSDKAQKALMANEINVGHAELISTLTADNQDNAVDSIVEKGISVADLKAKLADFAYKLETAIFSTEGCTGCPHNSSSQFTLFDDSIGDGCCSNPDCWSEKEQSRLAYLKKSKEEDYNVVFLDVERTGSSYNFLQENIVGTKQYSQCQQCQSLGALISTRRETFSETDENVCFDTDCYKKKVALLEKQNQPEKTTNSKPQSKSASSVKKKVTVDNKPPKKVLEFRTKLHKDMVARETITDKHFVLAMNACLLLESLPSQHSGSEMIKTVSPMFKLALEAKHKSTSVRHKQIPALYALNDEQLHEIIAFCVSVCASSGENNFDLSTPDKAVDACLTILKPDEENHFLLTKDFLACNQKHGIIAVLKESGFDGWLEQTENPISFAKLLNKKVSEIIEKFTSSKFPATGFVPNVLRYKRIKTSTNETVTQNN